MPDKATFAYHAARDLIQRSRSGTLYYVVIFLIITLLTSYYVDHPALMSADSKSRGPSRSEWIR